MLPTDFDVPHIAAIGLLLLSWFSYSRILRTFARGSLNTQLALVRRIWMTSITQRETKPFDAILLGHIINSIAFFGSATLIVLAGLITAFAGLKTLHATMSELHFTASASLELFALHLAFLAFILALSFFSFTYALRKLIYVIALTGALPDKQDHRPEHDIMVSALTDVLSEAIKTFNFGIRGYYYAIAAIFLFVSPYACIAATVFATTILFYRQLATPTARAIQSYVDAASSMEK